MNTQQKILRTKAPSNLNDFANLEQLLAAIELQWENAHNENACALHRSGLTGTWSSQDFLPGNISSVKIDMKAIIKTIVALDSDAIIICHNHIHNDPRPSRADFRTTEAVSRLCRTLEIEFIDHVIFARGSCFSFRKHGYV